MTLRLDAPPTSGEGPKHFQRSPVHAVCRIYIPLPNEEGRAAILSHLLQDQVHSLKGGDFSNVVKATALYSASDLTALSKCVYVCVCACVRGLTDLTALRVRACVRACVCVCVCVPHRPHCSE